MKLNLLRIASFVLSLGIVSSAAAQQQSPSAMSKYATKRMSIAREGSSFGTSAVQKNDFFVPIPDAVAIPGSYPIGIGSKYQLQTNDGGLHNIQVDPSDPSKIHAVVMEVPNVTAADTSSYLNRNCYYVFSSDGGVTWTTPKAVAKSRGGFPDMVLRKKANGDYVPVIALHRNPTSDITNFVTSLYMETGNPGDGNFVGIDADQTTGDGLSDVDIIWPSVALSPDGSRAYVVAAYDNTKDASSIDDIQFGWFGLTDAGPQTWSGWSTGPDDGSFNGYTSDGEYSINVSPSGKIGLAWVCYNYGSERALYYAESTDGGATWPPPTPLWEPTDSASEVASSGTTTYLIADGVELLFEGEVPYVAFSANDEDIVANPTYIPESGTLGIWSPAINAGVPLLLLSSTRKNALITGTFDDGSFLSPWTKPTYVDPQGPNLQYSTLAHVPGSSEWNIYFQAWVNSDTTSDSIFTITNSDGSKISDTVSEPYNSIYRMYTLDNGNTWTAEPVLTNNLDGSGPKIDYRYPEVSTFLPVVQNTQHYPTMFAADSVAGVFQNSGYPNWDIMDWYYRIDTLGGAPSGVAPGAPGISLGLQQNYPNPSTRVSKIAFSLPEESNVLLTVEDVLGRPIATLVNGPLGPGDHSAVFNAGDLPDGVYSYTLHADGQSVTKSLTLIR